MGLVDITFNFFGLFYKCFGSKNDNLDVFMTNIQNEKNRDVIISEILLKIINCSFKVGLLYEYIDENTMKLIKEIGDYEIKKIQYYYSVNIPFFDGNKFKYSLVILSDK